MKKLLVVATAIALGFAYGDESKKIDESVVTNGGHQCNVEKCKVKTSKTVAAKPPVTSAEEKKPLKSCCCGGSADANKVPMKFSLYQKGSTPYIQKKLSKEEVAERVAKMRKERDEKFSKIRESREEVKNAILRGKKVSEKKESK